MPVSYYVRRELMGLYFDPCLFVSLLAKKLKTLCVEFNEIYEFW